MHGVAHAAGSSACLQKAGTQAELNGCASREAERADSELDRAYKKLISTIAGDPDAIMKVSVAEHAWLTYRKAYLDAAYPAQDKQTYGTMFPMEFDLLRAEITHDQIKALDNLQTRQFAQ